MLHLLEEPSERRLASLLLDHIGAMQWNGVLHRIGPNAEGGWEIQAWHEQTGERVSIAADRFYDAAVELAGVVGVELDDG